MSLSGAWDEPQTAIFSKAITKKGPYWRGNETVHHHKNTFHQAWREHLLGWVGCFIIYLVSETIPTKTGKWEVEARSWNEQDQKVLLTKYWHYAFSLSHPGPVSTWTHWELSLLLPWLNAEMSVHSWNRGLAWNVNFWKWPGQAFILHSLRVYFFGSLNLGVYFSGFESCLCHFQHDFRWRFGFLILKKDEIIVKRIVLIS